MHTENLTDIVVYTKFLKSRVSGFHQISDGIHHNTIGDKIEYFSRSEELPELLGCSLEHGDFVASLSLNSYQELCASVRTNRDTYAPSGVSLQGLVSLNGFLANPESCEFAGTFIKMLEFVNEFPESIHIEGLSDSKKKEFRDMWTRHIFVPNESEQAIYEALGAAFLDSRFPRTEDRPEFYMAGQMDEISEWLVRTRSFAQRNADQFRRASYFVFMSARKTASRIALQIERGRTA